MREEKKIKPGISALLIVALVFAIIGVIYTPLGFMLGKIPGPGRILHWVFSGIGVGFLLVAAICLILYFNHRGKIQNAYDYGDCIECVIEDLVLDRSVRVNNNGMTRVRATYTDSATGTVHVYLSHRMKYCPSGVIGQKVHVYVDRGNEKYYYMDIDELMPEIVYHTGSDV